jgi:putative ABC transport system substrate-binding protein
MKRRDFMTALAGATAWIAAARAQELRRVVGVLGSASYGAFPGVEAAFIQGLKNTGFVEGTNISIEWRWAEGQYNRLPSLADELARRNVAVIVTWDVPASFAAKAATKTIPVVFAIGTDPLSLGLVDSFNQPHGNLTGVTTFLSSLGPKQLELLQELLPGRSRVAFLVNPSNLNSRIDAHEIQAAADALGQHLEVLTASSEDELDAAFTTMVRERIDALLVKPDPFFIDRCKRLASLASRHAVPAIYSLPVFVEVGGLMSYGNDLAHSYQQAGVYVGKILRGAKPADLPIQQSIKFELVIKHQDSQSTRPHLPAITDRSRR